jgi:RNA polymerase sigma-70 factor, ECF subfamily
MAAELPDPTLTEVFLAALPGSREAEARAVPGLDDQLDAIVGAAAAEHPGIEAPRAAFLEHLARRVGAGDEPLVDAMATVRGSDLYLAFACARGDAQAIRRFEQRYFVEIGPALRRLTRSNEHEDELTQQLREKLFVPRDGTAPKIADYSGRGELRSWVRAAIVRTTLNLVTRTGGPPATGGDELDLIPDGGADPEMLHMRRLYQEAFKAALVDAIAKLTPRDRTLLRYAHADGLGIDAIGTVYGVHRATAARWLSRARDALTAELRRALTVRLEVGASEYESILRVVQSQLDLSVQRYFRSTGETDVA